MTTLLEALGKGEKRKSVVRDVCDLIDQEVSDKSGLSGVAIKTAFKVVKGVKAGFIPDVVNALLDDFLGAIEPMYAAAQAANIAPGAYLKNNSGQAAESLLGVTDTRAKKADKGVVLKTYEKLRPTAKKHVEAAIPRLGDLLDRQLGGE